MMGRMSAIKYRLGVWCATLGFASATWAQNGPPIGSYPSRPLRLIIPAGAGGGVDTVSRLVGARLASALGQTVIMDNKPGAGTMLASEFTAKAPADGYTLLMATNSHAINAALHRAPRYDPVEDFSTVSFVASLPYLLVVHPSVPARSVRELLTLAKKYPGKLDFASAGTGSSTHLAFELFVSQARITAMHVPYKSGSMALVDLTGGHVQMMFSNIINCLPHVKNRRLVALAISSPQPSDVYPGLATVAASGVPGYSAQAWYGMLAPAQVPAAIVARLNQEINVILRDSEMRERLAALGAEVAGSSPQAFAALLRKDIQQWSKVTASLRLQMR
jgi:tripartite-type tricarboxylate transporter receptor subunit TctC